MSAISCQKSIGFSDVRCFGVCAGLRLSCWRNSGRGRRARPRRGKLAHVTGTASYRERIELPPGAVFEAMLEDVSVADAPARELGRATLRDPGNPPFAFDIAYDPADIRPERHYSVRTQVSVGRRLIFVSDR